MVLTHGFVDSTKKFQLFSFFRSSCRAIAWKRIVWRVLVVSTVSSTSCTGGHQLEDWNQWERSVGSVDTIVIIVSGCLSAVALCVY